MGVKSKIFVFIALLLTLSFFYLKQEGNFENLNTKHKFRIYKDEHGIPRIYAKDRMSLFYGFGFAEAQDRLWTLHLRKMIVRGRLSEIFGPEALPLDL